MAKRDKDPSRYFSSGIVPYRGSGGSSQRPSQGDRDPSDYFSPAIVPYRDDGLAERARELLEQCARLVPNTLGLLSESEAQSSKQHYHLGSLRIADADAAVDAVVAAYPKASEYDEPFYSFREYLHGCSRIETILSQIDRLERWQGEERRIQADWESKQAWSDTPVSRPRHPIPSLPNTVDVAFAGRFQRDRFTPDRKGYLNYLKRLVPGLYAILQQQIPVRLKHDLRKPHAYVLGTSGSGKTELLKILIHALVTDPSLGSVVVLDPHGDFVGQVARWREFLESDRLIYVRPKLVRGTSPTINPFEISGVDPSDYSLEALETKQVVAQELVTGFERIIADGGPGSTLTLPMRVVLTPCVLALLDRPGSTLVDLQRFMRDEKNEDLVAFGRALSHQPHVAAYFAEGFHDEGTKTTKLSIYRKLTLLLQVGTFANLTCGKSTIDLEKALNERKVVLFDLGKGAIGREEGRAFARLIVAMLLGIALRREKLPKSKRVPCSLIIDECHNYITESMEEILVEARKYMLFLTLSQQIAGYRMPLEFKRVVFGNTNLQFTGGAPKSGQQSNAELFGVEPDAVGALEIGEFFVRASRQSPTLKFRTRTDLLDTNNAMTAASWRSAIAEQLRAYYRSTEVSEPEKTVGTEAAAEAPEGTREAPHRGRRKRELI